MSSDDKVSNVHDWIAEQRQMLIDDDVKYGYGLNDSNRILYLDRILEDMLCSSSYCDGISSYGDKLIALVRHLNQYPSILMSVKYAKRKYGQYLKRINFSNIKGGKISD